MPSCDAARERHADLVPDAPVERERRALRRAAPRGEGVEERVGGDVVDLAGRGDRGAGRGEQHEERQRALSRAIRSAACPSTSVPWTLAANAASASISRLASERSVVRRRRPRGSRRRCRRSASARRRRRRASPPRRVTSAPTASTSAPAASSARTARMRSLGASPGRAASHASHSARAGRAARRRSTSRAAYLRARCCATVSPMPPKPPVIRYTPWRATAPRVRRERQPRGARASSAAPSRSADDAARGRREQLAHQGVLDLRIALPPQRQRRCCGRCCAGAPRRERPALHDSLDAVAHERRQEPPAAEPVRSRMRGRGRSISSRSRPAARAGSPCTGRAPSPSPDTARPRHLDALRAGRDHVQWSGVGQFSPASACARKSRL